MNLRVPLKLFNIVACRRTLTCRTAQNVKFGIVNNFRQHVPCASRMFSSEKSKDEDEITNDQMNEMLQYDTELQSFLKDIVKDFENHPPPPDPPKAQQQQAGGGTEHKPPGDDKESGPQKVPVSLLQRYKQYRDEDAEVILDVDEEKRVEEQEFYLYQEKKDKFSDLDLKRGKTGVFDLPELVNTLREENLRDIAVISVSKDLHYTDYLVIATAKSPRHSKAVMEFIRKLHKLKKNSKDAYIRLEGDTCHDWKVLDMGNIVLHVFLPEARERYDIETLWTVGEEYDDLCNKPQDPFYDVLEEEMQFLEAAQSQTAKQ